MGDLVEDRPVVDKLYGELAIRFNGLRKLYRCVAAQVNAEKPAAECAK